MQFGRSMIEMLGVLAIIGVLSVSGIAGYTKAMRIYNSNLQRQQISEIIAGMLQIQPSLNFKDTYTDLTSAFNALNITPSGLEYQSGALRDKFGNKILIKYVSINGGRYYTDIFLAKDSSNRLTSTAMDYCINALNVAKKNANVLKYILLWTSKTDEESTVNSGYYYHGNRNCNKSRTCLKDMSAVQMYQACKFCTEKDVCVVAIDLWP